jgi:hypothetical protein
VCSITANRNPGATKRQHDISHITRIRLMGVLVMPNVKVSGGGLLTLGLKQNAPPAVRWTALVCA